MSVTPVCPKCDIALVQNGVLLVCTKCNHFEGNLNDLSPDVRAEVLSERNPNVLLKCILEEVHAVAGANGTEVPHDVAEDIADAIINGSDHVWETLNVEIYDKLKEAGLV